MLQKWHNVFRKDTLTSEVYFLREELKDKNLLIKSNLNKTKHLSQMTYLLSDLLLN